MSTDLLNIQDPLSIFTGLYYKTRIFFRTSTDSLLTSTKLNDREVNVIFFKSPEQVLVILLLTKRIIFNVHGV